MDPISVLGAVASVIAILQLSAKVLSYFNDVKDASKGLAQCAIEVSNLHSLLTNLRFRLEEGHGHQRWFNAVHKLAVQNGPFDQFKQTLETLQTKITDGGRLKRVGEALVWKFKKDEVDNMLAQMERLKTLVEIALSMDHFKLSQAIKNDTDSVRTNVSAIESAVDKIQLGQITASQRALLENYKSQADQDYHSILAALLKLLGQSRPSDLIDQSIAISNLPIAFSNKILRTFSTDNEDSLAMSTGILTSPSAHNQTETKISSTTDLSVSTSDIYTALPSRSSIRLLHLSPAIDMEETISCELTIHQLDEQIPSYIALSYVWGEREPAAQIVVNGSQFTITPNLHDALRNVRDSEATKVLWVDAICINQANLGERNTQVTLMRYIYPQAVYVIAYLGPAVEGYLSKPTRTVAEELSTRPYWTRVWVMQEFALATKVRVQFGDAYIDDLTDLYAFSSFGEYPFMLSLVFLRESVHHMRGKWDPLYEVTLHDAIEIAKRSTASDARDRIYGVLSLAHPRRNTIQPDYSLSNCEVFCQAIRAVGKDTPRLAGWGRSNRKPTDPDPEAEVDPHHDRKKCNGDECGSWLHIMSWPSDNEMTSLLHHDSDLDSE
ncbi:HET-domain-containing protein [Pyrenochaeta sp. DS3sAY3a]|nr:HET-domain-containing protein [Pyrenochaeta sp. DS3sAY3a]